ncbi:hypothetical protein ADP71_17920 [Vitreoscilla sp. C1]|nr:hypothetical protein ADP71_17920 [Vitreoscilla sp. C1]
MVASEPQNAYAPKPNAKGNPHKWHRNEVSEIIVRRGEYQSVTASVDMSKGRTQSGANNRQVG